MTRADDVLNIILGVCAVAYSFLPPRQLPQYRRGLALVLRIGGMGLVLVAGANMALGRQRAAPRGTLAPEKPLAPLTMGDQ